MFNIFRRQVGAKIILGYLASLSLMVIIGGLAVGRLTQVTQTVNDLTNNQAVELDLSNAMVDQIVLARLYSNRYILYQNQADLDAFHASFSQLQELLAKAEQKITNPERAAKLPALQENAVVYGAAFDEIVGLLAQRARIRSEVFNAQEMLMGLKLAALRVNAPANNATLYHLALGNLQTDYLNMRLNLLNYIVTGENRFVALFDLNYQEVQKHLADLHSASTTPAQQQTLADIEVTFQTYAQGFTEVQTGYTRLHQLQQTQLEIAGPAMSQAAFDVAAQVKREFQAKNADIHAFVVQTQIVLLAAILSAIAIGLGMGGIAARRITRPLRQVTQTAQQIATVDIKAMSSELVSLSQGKPGRLDLNLTASPLQINSPDELGQLGQAFNQIIFSLGVAEQAFRSMTDYLNEMAEAACRVAQGQLEVNVAVRSPEDGLGNALAHMVANLRTTEVELRQYQEHLEELVVERTAALRESQRAMTTLLGNLPGMAYRCRNDRDWTMEFISQGCQELTGYPPLALINNAELAYADLIHPDDREWVWQQLQAALRERRSFQMTYRLTARTGQEKWVWEQGQAVFDNHGQVAALEGLVTDMTAHKQLEEALRQAKEAAETANRAKSTFLANMSHELRTPLNAILGFSQMMTHNTALPTEHRDNLNIITTSGEHLLTLINQVLDLSKVEAGRMSLEEKEFDLYRLLDDLAAMFRLRAENKGLRLIFERIPAVPQYVCADEVKLRQVLINLLNNAVKFTEVGSVTVQVGITRQDSGVREQELFLLLHFSVSDTGPGIAPDELPTLFDAFSQTEIGRQVQEGTGLGLTISHKFVQLMGGEIQVESEVGRGTTVRFEVRVKQLVAPAGLKRAVERQVVGLAPGQPSYRLLIVDDKWDNRQLLLKLLAPLGFELRQAENGQQAIQIWQEWQPHLIWMDIRMPLLDGYEATRQIKSQISNPQSPIPNPKPTGQASQIPPIIIAVTASAFEEEQAEMLPAGCDDFLRKPFHEAEVLELLRQYLGLQYLYEAERPVSPEAEQPAYRALIPADLAALRPELLDSLTEAVTRLYIEAIDRVIAEIRLDAPDVAAGLARLAADFNYEEILALIQAARP